MTPMTLIQATIDADPRAHFGVALATASDAVEGVRPDQLGDPTPYREFDVQGLLAHLLGVLDRVTAIGLGADPFGVERRDVDDDGWIEAWHDAAGALQAVWADEAALERPSPLSWAPGTGAEALASYVSELTVHTWDLATATGQRALWDPDVLELVASGLGGMPEVPVPDDAPLIDRIVAWNGRQP
jgi:uncharacterized protein (TIGR03086 family)